MRVYLLLIILLFSYYTQGQVFQHHLLIIKKQNINIYDVNTDSVLLSISLSSNNNWKIGKINKYHNRLSILIHNGINIINTNFDKGVIEKEITIDIQNLSVMYSYDRIIVQNDSGLYIERSGIKLKELNFRDRYKQNNNTLYSIDGNVFIVKKDLKYKIIEAMIRGKLRCGYYNPNLSYNGKSIICEYKCSKYNGKKKIGESQIIEIDCKTKQITKMQLFGYYPSYSTNGELILYKKADGYHIYYKYTGKNLHLLDVSEAVWIR